MVSLSESQKEFMKEKYFASLAIISPNTGLPLNTTVWAHWHESTEKFYVITNKKTAKWRYLRDGDKKIGINICNPRGWPYISINGTAKVFFEDDRDDFWEIITNIIEKYNDGESIENWKKKMEDAPEDARRMLVELEPENIFSTV